MRRRSFLSLATATLITTAVTARSHAQTAEVGKAAPSFAIRDSAGRLVDSGAYAGRLLVLEWTNPICPFAGKHYKAGTMQALQERVRDAGGGWFSVITFSADASGEVSDLEAEQLAEERASRATATILDPETRLARQFGARATPHLFVIDRAGRLAYGGGMDSIASTSLDDMPRAIPFARLAVDAVIAGTPVPHPVTRPYGCPVKYAGS